MCYILVVNHISLHISCSYAGLISCSCIPTASLPDCVLLTLPLHPLLSNDTEFPIPIGGLVDVAAAAVAVVTSVTVVAACGAAVMRVKPTGMDFSQRNDVHKTH